MDLGKFGKPRGGTPQMPSRPLAITCQDLQLDQINEIGWRGGIVIAERTQALSRRRVMLSAMGLLNQKVMNRSGVRELQNLVEGGLPLARLVETQPVPHPSQLGG